MESKGSLLHVCGTLVHSNMFRLSKKHFHFQACEEGCGRMSSSMHWHFHLLWIENLPVLSQSTWLTLTHCGRAPSVWWGSPHMEPQLGRHNVDQDSRGAAEATTRYPLQERHLLPTLAKPHGNPGGCGANVQFEDNWGIIQTLGFNEHKINFIWLLPRVELLYILFLSLFLLCNST